MDQKTIKGVCTKNSATVNRFYTDKEFRLPVGAFSYTGIIDGAIRYIEKRELLNADLWKKFVNQFRSNTDGDNCSWKGEYWGKMMRGAAWTYRYTRNEKLYRVLCDTAEDLCHAADENGRISTYSVDREFDGWDLWCRKYVLLGFQYFLDIVKKEDEKLRKKVVKTMCRHADYIMEHIGDPKDGKKLITRATRNWGGLNSSSILEPFVRLYTITGEEKYLGFSKYIIDCGGTYSENIFDLALEDKLYPSEYQWKKAYEKISCFEGIIEYYRVTGEEKYKELAVRFGKKLIADEITLIGSAGCTHELFDRAALNQSNTEYNGLMLETCVTVTWMKFAWQLLCLTGDPAFADEIERSVYNAMLGSVNSENAKTMFGFPFDSYSPLFMGSRARTNGGFQLMENGTFAYGCCACIGSAGTALMALSSVTQKKNGIFINLFIPGKVTLTAPSGKEFTLVCKTHYPVSGKVKYRVSGLSEKEKFSVSVRVPSWCENASLEMGKAKINITSAGYAKIEKEWEDGDTFALDFAMDMRVVFPPLGGKDENSRYLVALRRGPVMFARDRRFGERIDSVVDIDFDEKGYVKAKPSAKANFDTLMEYSVPCRDGSYFTVCDYQSAGKTWNEDSYMTMWMITKNFREFDPEKPFYMFNPGTRANDKWYISSSGDVLKMLDSDTVPEEKWEMLVSRGKIKIRSLSGRYLTVRKDAGHGMILSTSEKDPGANGVWELRNIVMNRYRLVHKKTGLCAMTGLLQKDTSVRMIDPFANETESGFSYTNNAFVDFINCSLS